MKIKNMTTYSNFNFKIYPESGKLFFHIRTDEKEGSFQINGFKLKLRINLNCQTLAVTNGQGKICISKSFKFDKSRIEFKSEKSPVFISGWVFGDFYFNRKRTLDHDLIKSSLHLT